MSKFISKVIDITAKMLDLDPSKVTPSSRFTEDLGADSLDCVELMVAFEETFALEIPEEDLTDLTTVAAVADYLRDRDNAAVGVLADA
ncbi:acyl carrier protein [Defluviimonas sp. 20V17]|uniref:Acyl carrier protein n=1 Tax=Allgaiera indica TaxID=765699 RepID=A0AAN4USZ4_9RHOB|nr:acyl carrier protein [Allgaiera indica]KDB01904.1 acyl carrier protein [Defluviimonas sp. 20V17]GHE03407.1 acyl carrier protein [Allgaiera indica]SDX24822.1 acyl carrier protein/NADH dehydrogenase (ubiquinone) 1 alpha/beta subcomplex 1 [Allgaiera indica]